MCEIDEASNFFVVWAVLTALGTTATLTLSGFLFYRYYVNPTYEQWVWKSNKEFPSPLKVRDEIWQMLKG